MQQLHQSTWVLSQMSWPWAFSEVYKATGPKDEKRRGCQSAGWGTGQTNEVLFWPRLGVNAITATPSRVGPWLFYFFLSHWLIHSHKHEGHPWAMSRAFVCGNMVPGALCLCLVSEFLGKVDGIQRAVIPTLISRVHRGPWNPIRQLKYGGQLEKTPVRHCHVWNLCFLFKSKVTVLMQNRRRLVCVCGGEQCSGLNGIKIIIKHYWC